MRGDNLQWLFAALALSTTAPTIVCALVACLYPGIWLFPRDQPVLRLLCHQDIPGEAVALED